MKRAEGRLEVFHAPEILMLPSALHFPTPEKVWHVCDLKSSHLTPVHSMFHSIFVAAHGAVVMRRERPLAHTKLVHSDVLRRALHLRDVPGHGRSNGFSDVLRRVRATPSAPRLASIHSPSEIEVCV